MKQTILCILLSISCNLISQVPDKYQYPDTLWIYGNAIDSTYGLRANNPIKVGGGILPKHIYRYLNSLINNEGKEVNYERIGVCYRDEINSKKPLTKFRIKNGNDDLELYFDQHEWEYPKLIYGFQWNESRKGYHGEIKQDTIFHGYGIYFFDDGGFYKGYWENGIMKGKGEMLIPDQEQYLGEFENGEYHGFGILKYSDGGRYEGMWLKGKKEGKGKIFYPLGSEIEYIEGEFKNDEPIGKFIIYKHDKTQETHKF